MHVAIGCIMRTCPDCGGYLGERIRYFEVPGPKRGYPNKYRKGEVYHFEREGSRVCLKCGHVEGLNTFRERIGTQHEKTNRIEPEA